MGAWKSKNRLDHREYDSRVIFSFVSQLLSDSNNKKSPRDDGFSQGIMLSQSANVAIIGYLVQMSLNICTYIYCGVSAFAKRHLIGTFGYYHSHRSMCRKVAEYATTSGYVIHSISAT